VTIFLNIDELCNEAHYCAKITLEKLDNVLEIVGPCEIFWGLSTILGADRGTMEESDLGGYWWPPTCSKFQLAHLDNFQFNTFLYNGEISL
jgi:hypothetical protein